MIPLVIKLIPKIQMIYQGTDASGLESDDELILRVPLAVPVVKILQLNSAAIVEQHIPGIVAKIASFLKSKVSFWIVIFAKQLFLGLWDGPLISLL